LEKIESELAMILETVTTNPGTSDFASLDQSLIRIRKRLSSIQCPSSQRKTLEMSQSYRSQEFQTLQDVAKSLANPNHLEENWQRLNNLVT